ncbi:MAG: NAD+ synthase [Pseudomonadota bacterium]
MKIVVEQINFIVGDVIHNTSRILEAANKAEKDQAAELVVFSELCLSGYPPEDLLFRPALFEHIEKSLQRLIKELNVAIVIGFPSLEKGVCYNALALISEGRIQTIYHKQCLPNYSVFDEKRYFQEGREATVTTLNGVKLGWLICEDIWHKQPSIDTKLLGADLLICINASPFNVERHWDRAEQLKKCFQNAGLPIIYVNQVGGQDELVFDGGSLAVDHKGNVHRLCPFFEESSALLRFRERKLVVDSPQEDMPSAEALIYDALTLGVKDYVNKNHFKGALIGLSGGIDSALTLAIAVDALGASNVEAIMMPFDFTSDWSKEDASEQAKRLGVKYHQLPIHGLYNAALEVLTPVWGKTLMDTTEQNIQARARGLLLMALSNKTGKILLTTGNKSEMAVGYATLYGDMAGGFAALKDVPKMLVYQLANFRNSLGEVIPERVIERAPSAELAPDQVDEDNLPPYDELDKILEMYIDQELGIRDIVAFGFNEDVVRKVVRLIDINEYKRRQSAPGVRISKQAFGKERRYPITSGFRKLD